MRRSLSRRYSTYSTDSEGCRYQCGEEQKKTHNLFISVPIDALAGSHTRKKNRNEGDAQPGADNCVIDSQKSERPRDTFLRHCASLALESGLPKHSRRQIAVT